MSPDMLALLAGADGAIDIVDQFAFESKKYSDAYGVGLMETPRGYDENNPYSISGLAGGLALPEYNDNPGRAIVAVKANSTSNNVLDHEVGHRLDQIIAGLLDEGLKNQSEDPDFQAAMRNVIAYAETLSSTGTRPCRCSAAMI